MNVEDTAALIAACTNSSSSCRQELITQVVSPVFYDCVESADPTVCRDAGRRAMLEAFAKDQGLPPSTVDLAERCIDNDTAACEKLVAIASAQAACVSYTGGACPQCCGEAVVLFVDLVWPVIGPLIDGLVKGAAALGAVALEQLGLKDKPTFRDDVYLSMRADAEAKLEAFVTQFAKAFEGAEVGKLSGPGLAKVLLEQELQTFTPASSPNAGPLFTRGLWLPTNYGNVALPAGQAPWGAEWDLKWDKAWERDNAFQAGAQKLAQMYGIRFDAVRLSAARVTGVITAIEQQARRPDLVNVSVRPAQPAKPSLGPRRETPAIVPVAFGVAAGGILAVVAKLVLASRA